ncbi:MAG: hypothetical protein ACRCSQ_09020 [Bacteroidales bacterium]
MKPKKKIKKYLTKGLRKVRYRKGFGVHSPFAFSLITQVIDESAPFYAYEEILKLKKKYSPLTAILPKFVSRRMTSVKVLFLLYRLINRFGPKTILEVGNQGGLVSYVMGLPNTRAEVTSVGDDKQKLAIAQRLFDQERPHNYRFLQADVESGIDQLGPDYRADFIFIHESSIKQPEQLYESLLKHIHARTVVIIEGIKRTDQVKRLWNLFHYDPNVRVSMDLYEAGIAIYHDSLFKQHYIVSF